MRIITSTAVLLVLAGCVGCESNAPPSAAAQSADAAPPPPQPVAPPENAAHAQPAAPGVQQAVAVQPAEPVAGDPADREKAQVGVGKRGRDYEPGFITTPIAAYFRTGDRIAFEVQIPSAMKLYKA
ncbi:MAG TPA: hypothetical protein VGZ26_03510, partial [Pirellulales bacterium]|nr:hypothetical protein [Pirellulales bacterium]